MGEVRQERLRPLLGPRGGLPRLRAELAVLLRADIEEGHGGDHPSARRSPLWLETKGTVPNLRANGPLGSSSGTISSSTSNAIAEKAKRRKLPQTVMKLRRASPAPTGTGAAPPLPASTPSVLRCSAHDRDHPSLLLSQNQMRELLHPGLQPVLMHPPILKTLVALP